MSTSYDSVEYTLIKEGYSLKRISNSKDSNGEYNSYDFEKIDISKNAYEDVVCYKKLHDPLSVFFDRIFYMTFNKDVYYNLKEQLGKDIKFIGEETLNGCLRREYSNGLIGYVFGDCPDSGVHPATYNILIYFDWFSH